MVETPTRYQALLRAIEVAGSQSELARLCGLSPTSVWKWVNQSKQLPAEFVLRVEEATGVSRHHLRPDIYPVEHQPIPHPAAFRGVDRGAGRVSFNRSTGMKAARA